MEYDYPSQTEKSIKELLQATVMQQSLIDKKATLAGLDKMPPDVTINDIFFGTGISNPQSLTQGVPFDFLLYPLIAAKIQRAIGLPHIHHLIADKHALINKFDAKDVRKTATHIRMQMEDIVSNLNIDNYHIYLSSEVATDRNYQALLDKVKGMPFANEYAWQEAVDVEYFHVTRNVLVKLGWKFAGNSNFGEDSFDREHNLSFGTNVIPVYTASGKRFDDLKPNTVPYTLYPDEMPFRIIIDRNERVVEKKNMQICKPETVNMLENTYRPMVRLFEEIVTKMPAGNTWEKMQYIIEFLTQ